MRTMMMVATMVLLTGVGSGIGAEGEAVSSPAAAGKSSYQVCQLTLPSEPYRRLVLILEQAASARKESPGQSIPLHLHCRGNQITGGFTRMPLKAKHHDRPKDADSPVCVPYYVNTSYLKWEGDRIHGSMPIFSHMNHPGRSRRADWEIDLKLEGNRATGTYKFKWNGRHKWDRYREKTGTMSGTMVEGKDLRKPELSYAPGKDFPCHRGRFGNGTTPDCGRELVSDLKEARLLWVSEEKVAGAYDQGLHGSHSTPIFADGDAFMYYWEGCGEAVRSEREVSKKKQNQSGSMTPEELKVNRAVESMDVITRIDGVTGQTRWVARFPGNLDNAGQEGGHHTPVYGDGKVFAQGQNGKVYCVDAKTGKLIWRKADFPGTVVSYWTMVDQVKARGKEPVGGVDKSMPPKPAGKKISHINNCLQYADGVLLVTDKTSRGGLVGLDGATGRVVWEKKPKWPSWFRGNGAGGGDTWESPIVWRHKGVGYFLASGWCIKAKTGKVMWQLDGTQGGNTIAADERFMVCYRGSPYKHPRTGKPTTIFSPACFKLSPEKAELCWHLAGWEYSNRRESLPCVSFLILDGYAYLSTSFDNPVVHLETGKIVANPRQFLNMSSVSSDGVIVSGGETPQFLRADPKRFEILGRSFFLSTICVSPCLADGRLFVRMNRGLACFDLRHPSYETGEARARALICAPAEIVQGDEAELWWRTLNAESVRIEPGIGAVSGAPAAQEAVATGTVRVRPETTTTYTLVAEGKGGPSKREATVVVYPPRPAVSGAGLKPGLKATYYEYEGGGKLPAFETEISTGKGIVERLAFEERPAQAVKPKLPSVLDDDEPENKKPAKPVDQFAGAGRTRNVAAVFEGFVKVDKKGLYEFTLESYHGSALLIGDEKVVDHDGDHHRDHQRVKSGKIGLAAGCHPIRVLYCLGDKGKCKYDFRVGRRGLGGGQKREVVPASALFHR